MKKQKILCVCQGGNVRSVAMGFLLKYTYGCDAIACGWEGNTPETLAMLAKWADVVIVMETGFKEKIPKRFHKKLSVFDVGPDRWFNSLHPELLQILNGMILQQASAQKTEKVA